MASGCPGKKTSPSQPGHDKELYFVLVVTRRRRGVGLSVCSEATSFHSKLPFFGLLKGLKTKDKGSSGCPSRYARVFVSTDCVWNSVFVRANPTQMGLRGKAQYSRKGGRERTERVDSPELGGNCRVPRAVRTGTMDRQV
jgi:hypothetical protein